MTATNFKRQFPLNSAPGVRLWFQAPETETIYCDKLDETEFKPQKFELNLK